MRHQHYVQVYRPNWVSIHRKTTIGWRSDVYTITNPLLALKSVKSVVRVDVSRAITDTIVRRP